jgi:peptide/nickel transport system substrate-binding protein
VSTYPGRILGALALGLAIATPLLAVEATARSIKVARTGDSLTLDPHAQNEGPTHALAHQIYEPLVIRDAAGKMLPALAVSWGITADPLVWEFKLRPGVKFHDGTPFTVDDVIFSYNRALQPTSDMKQLLSSVDQMTKVDDFTLRIKTKGPNPLLPNNLGDLFIMSKAWTEKNNATKVQDFKAKEENFSVRNANGTGPFVLVTREPDVKTVMKRNDAYWGLATTPNDITELTFMPLKTDATRVAALLSGEVDFVQDVPVQDIERLRQDQKLQVKIGAENRSIFLGMNVGDAELSTSDIKGKNPFADKRVRQAINMTVNRAAIQRVVMRGQSIPTGIIAPPGVNGYTRELDQIPAADAAKAKALITEAGYPNGFAVSFHCPNDRYVNDEAICQAVVGQLAPLGIKASLVSQSKSLHFPMIQKQPPQVDFYLLGWGVPTFDSDYVFSFLYRTRTDKLGGWNATRYSNPELDKMIDGLSGEINLEKRNAEIAKIWAKLQDETVYIPIHIQTLAYAMKADLDVAVDISNQPKFKFAKLKK